MLAPRSRPPACHNSHLVAILPSFMTSAMLGQGVKSGVAVKKAEELLPWACSGPRSYAGTAPVPLILRGAGVTPPKVRSALQGGLRRTPAGVLPHRAAPRGRAH